MNTAKPFTIPKKLVMDAFKAVKTNAGSAGIDKQSIEDFEENLKDNLYKLWNRMSSGSYFPPPVKAVPIPKKAGGERILGVPTVADRVAQTVVKLMFEPVIEAVFLPDSYGYRPGKSALDAVGVTRERCWKYDWILEFDIKGLFDNIDWDLLLRAVQHHTQNKWIILYIERWLKAPLQKEDDTLVERTKGTPQGGPLSPLLCNLLLNEVDWELEKSGIVFVRYADDCNAYFRSKRAAQDAMLTLEKLLGKLKLKINPDKSAAAYVGKRKFLGYRFWIAPQKVVRRAVAPQALEKFKNKVRQLTSRTCGKSLEQVVERLDVYLLGWKNYFRLADTPRTLSDLDSWIRRRLRMILLKQWKRGKTCYRELVARGLSSNAAASIAGANRSYWKMAGTSGMNIAFPNAYFDELGLSRLKA